MFFLALFPLLHCIQQKNGECRCSDLQYLKLNAAKDMKYMKCIQIDGILNYTPIYLTHIWAKLILSSIVLRLQLVKTYNRLTIIVNKNGREIEIFNRTWLKVLVHTIIFLTRAALSISPIKWIEIEIPDQKASIEFHSPRVRSIKLTPLTFWWAVSLTKHNCS